MTAVARAAIDVASPRDEPPAEVIEAVARAIAVARFGDDAVWKLLRFQARAAITTYQKATSGDPRGEADSKSSNPQPSEKKP